MKDESERTENQNQILLQPFCFILLPVIKVEVRERIEQTTYSSTEQK